MDRKNLRETLFNPAYADRQAALAARIDELEAKLRAIEEHPGIDHEAVRAATTHTRLLCSPSGYELSEVDAPPPPPGATVDHDGSDVHRLAARPVAAARRRAPLRDPGLSGLNRGRVVGREHGEERLDDDGIELSARAADHLVLRFFRRERLAVRPVGRRHRRVRVGDGDDPRRERDVMAGETIRVTVPVPALV